MNLFINRESPVSIHDQLCAQIGQLVASGALTGGHRMPSIRGLAARLEIHHNTVLAAYRSLQDRGLLDIQTGSGVRVVDHAPPKDGWREGLALRAMAAHFVAMARAKGHEAIAIQEALTQALAPSPITRLVVVNPHDDLQDLYMHELGHCLSLPMRGMTLEEVEATGVEALADACLVTSTNHAPGLQKILGEALTPVLFKLSSAEALLARARELPAGAVVAIVSASPRYLFLTKELLAAVRGEDELLDAPLNDAERLGAAVRLAALVVTDSTSYEPVKALTRAPVYRHPLLADDVVAKLAEKLPPECFRPLQL